MAQESKKNSVLFVCLGNICRSTMAEAILHHLVKEKKVQDKWLIDSAATATWNIGSPPDPRTMKVLEKNGIKGYRHEGRLLTREDFTKFDYIFGMDDDNLIATTATWNIGSPPDPRTMKVLEKNGIKGDIDEVKTPQSTAKIELLGMYDPQKVKIIEDPYYTVHTNKNAFNEVYDQCFRCCTAFLDTVESS